MGFYEIIDPSSEEFECKILEIQNEKGIAIKKYWSRGYDGASTKSGQYSSLQNRIKNLVPNANFVYCAAHNLNLIFNDSANLPEVSQFYDIVQQTHVSSAEVDGNNWTK